MNGRLVISDTYLRCAHTQFQLDPNSAHDHYLKSRSNYILHLGVVSIILWLLGCKKIPILLQVLGSTIPVSYFVAVPRTCSFVG